jgi:hypothetical protein
VFGDEVVLGEVTYMMDKGSCRKPVMNSKQTAAYLEVVLTEVGVDVGNAVGTT